MLLFEHVVGFAFRKSSLTMISPALLILPLLLWVAGCTGEGADGPMIASLSTPTDETETMGSDQSQGPDLADDAEEDPVITMSSTSDGVTASLTWDPPPNVKVTGYQIYYAKHLAEDQGSEESIEEELDWSEGSARSEDSTSDKPSLCAYGESQTVEAPSATIVGLDPGTLYIFAIRAFNESESFCSNEIPAVTPLAQS